MILPPVDPFEVAIALLGAAFLRIVAGEGDLRSIAISKSTKSA